MASMTISLPDPMKDWLERHVAESGYASASDYLGELIRRDRQSHAIPDLTIDDLRQIVGEARASGDGGKPLKTIISEGDRIAAARGLMRG